MAGNAKRRRSSGAGQMQPMDDAAAQEVAQGHGTADIGRIQPIRPTVIAPLRRGPMRHGK